MSGILYIATGYAPIGYSSYDEYLSLSLHDGYLDTSSNHADVGFNNLVHDNASVLNFITRETASTQFSYKLYHMLDPGHNPATCLYCQHTNNSGGRPALINVSNISAEVASINAMDLSEPPFDSYGLMGCIAPYNLFDRVYGLNISLVDTDDPHSEDVVNYKIALATRHLKACGLSDEAAANYAKNLLYSEDQIEWGSGAKHYIKITAEPFDTFKTRFDSAQTP